jgi:hypothetical protein
LDHCIRRGAPHPEAASDERPILAACQPFVSAAAAAPSPERKNDAPAPIRRGGKRVDRQSGFCISRLFPIQLPFRRLIIRRLTVPVLLECEPDKPERHKDGSGHHHPMGVFPIEQQVEHFGHLPLSLFPLRLSGRQRIS